MAHLAYTTLYALRLLKHTKLRRLRGQDNLHVTARYYARLLPAGPKLREHSCSFTAIIALSCRKKTLLNRFHVTLHFMGEGEFQTLNPEHYMAVVDFFSAIPKSLYITTCRLKKNLSKLRTPGESLNPTLQNLNTINAKS